jgi:phosphatidylserine/phosphatidylglycerophosphate/cardiolipin synthase-like enzyme
MNQLSKLNDTDLRGLATALRTGRLVPPYSESALSRIVGMRAASISTAIFTELELQGLLPRQIASLLEMLLADRKARPTAEELIDFVVSGPEGGAAANRDTAVVVRDLFSSAEDAALVAGYAVYQGQQVFKALAERMVERPSLRVQMFLDVQRLPGDTTRDDLVVDRFLERFRTQQWPVGKPLPELFYDPRSLAIGALQHACLHAKCVVIDCHTVFVSSANFTEAAQDRNIEVGLLLRSPDIAKQLCDYFRSLIESGLLKAARWRN